MKLFTALLIFIKIQCSLAQSIKNIYFIPGQGSNQRIFDNINLDSSYNLHYLEIPTPKKGDKMNDIAKIVSQKIDKNQSFALIGVSLGGMICSEMLNYLKPQKVILISSAQNSKELPNRYRFQKIVHIYKLIPKKIIKKSAIILQPIVEPDSRTHHNFFKEMLLSKSPEYYKNTVSLILKWNKKSRNENIIQIHGTVDKTIPIKNITANYKILNGSHMMTYTKGKEISIILNEILRDSEQGYLNPIKYPTFV